MEDTELTNNQFVIKTKLDWVESHFDFQRFGQPCSIKKYRAESWMGDFRVFQGVNGKWSCIIPYIDFLEKLTGSSQIKCPSKEIGFKICQFWIAKNNEHLHFGKTLPRFITSQEIKILKEIKMKYQIKKTIGIGVFFLSPQKSRWIPEKSTKYMFGKFTKEDADAFIEKDKIKNPDTLYELVPSI